MKSITALASVLLLVTHVSQAAIVVTLFPGSDNLPQTVAGATLINTPDLDPGYARIDNSSHTDFGGESALTFARHYRLSDGECLYWFRATDIPTQFADSWSGVHWLGFGDNTLVDGAVWGADNFVMLNDNGDNTVGVLQFHFAEETKRATLIASAYDAGGLTFADGVAAIQATVPEPSTTTLLIGGIVVLFAFARRRKK